MIRNLVLFLSLLLAGPLCAVADGVRNESETIQPMDPARPAPLVEAIELFRSGDLTGAEDLLRYFVRTGIPMEDRIEGYAYRVLIQIQKKDFERGEEILQEMEGVLENGVPKGDVLWSDLWRMRAGHALHQFRTDEAMEWAHRALETAMDSGRRPIRQVRTLMATGLAHEAAGDYARAEIYFRSALARMDRLKSRHEQTWLTQKVIRNLATARFELGHLEEALDLFLEQRDLLLLIYDEDHLELTINRLNRGRVYAALGDHGLASDYFSSAIRGLQSHQSEYASTLLRAHSLAGYSYAQLGEKGESLFHLERAQALADSRFSADHPEMPYLYQHLAIYESLHGSEARALDQYDLAMRAWDQKVDENHPVRIPVLLNRADLFHRTGETERALEQYEHALTIAENHFLLRHPGLAEIWLGMARIHVERDDLDKAMDASLEAQEILTRGSMPTDPMSHPAFSRNYHPRLFLDVMQLKGDLYHAMYRNQGGTKLLSASYSAYLLAIRTLEQIQTGYQDEGSKLLLNRTHYVLFERAVEMAYQLWETTSRPSYLNHIYLISEASKARVSREKIRWRRPDSTLQLSDHLMEEEQMLAGKISRLHHELDRLRVTQDPGERHRLEVIQDSLFQLHHEKEAWLQQIANEYPEYGEWRTRRELVSIREVQERVLAPGQIALNYLVGEKSLYVILISQHHLSVHRLEGGDQVAGWIDMLRETIRTEDPTRFRQISRRLYRHLLEPLEPITSNYDQLLILPDDQLNYLPFNLLLSADTGHNRSWEWPYLIRTHEVSYAPSLTVYEETRREAPSQGDGLLAIAPWTRVDRQVVAPREARSVAGNLSPLPLSKYEVEAIAESRQRSRGVVASLFDRNENTLLLDEEATPNRLRSMELDRYRYIHLATHAYVHDEQPSMSGILLSPSESSTNGTLFLGEVEELKLNAHLVVLSACETGLGRLARGEGVIGFSRAFLKSGTENLVVSLWKVNDRATAQLMERLYQDLFDGFRVSAALRNAQLALIEQTETSFPSHWSSFVLIGG